MDSGSGLRLTDSRSSWDGAELRLKEVRAKVGELSKQLAYHQKYELSLFRSWLSDVCRDLIAERSYYEDRRRDLRRLVGTIQGLTGQGLRHVEEAFFWYREIAHCHPVPPHVGRAWTEINGEPIRSADFNSHIDDSRSDDQNKSADTFVGTADAPRSNERLKELFRQTARILHPDVGGVVTEERLQLWYEAQAAWGDRDLVRLERVFFSASQQHYAVRTLTELFDLLRQAEEKHDGLERELEYARTLGSWGFSKRDEKSRSSLREQLRQEMSVANAALIQECSLLEAELTRIKKRSSRWAARKRSQSRQMLLPFEERSEKMVWDTTLP